MIRRMDEPAEGKTPQTDPDSFLAALTEYVEAASVMTAMDEKADEYADQLAYTLRCRHVLALHLEAVFARLAA